MKAEVIRGIIHSTFEARNGVSLKLYEHIADDEVRALTYNIRILEQAGHSVVKTEELEAALKPFAKFAEALKDEVPDTIALGLFAGGDIRFGPDGASVGDLRRAAALLAAITQEEKNAE